MQARPKQKVRGKQIGREIKVKNKQNWFNLNFFWFIIKTCRVDVILIPIKLDSK